MGNKNFEFTTLPSLSSEGSAGCKGALSPFPTHRPTKKSSTPRACKQSRVHVTGVREQIRYMSKGSQDADEWFPHYTHQYYPCRLPFCGQRCRSYRQHTMSISKDNVREVPVTHLCQGAGPCEHNYKRLFNNNLIWLWKLLYLADFAHHHRVSLTMIKSPAKQPKYSSSSAFPPDGFLSTCLQGIDPLIM